jgi:uncharacterized membrane protein YcfT
MSEVADRVRAPVLPTSVSGDRGEAGATRPRERLFWMDVLRGAAVLLVVVNHAAVVLGDRAADLPPLVATTNDIFAPIRIPTISFLSGMLLAPSLAKGTRRYVGGKVRNVAYPYLVWTAVYIVVIVRPWVHEGGFGPARVARYVLTAPSPLWFIGFLLGFYLLAMVLRRVPPVLVIGATLLASMVFPDDTRTERFFFLFGFFLLGDLVTRHADTVQRWIVRPAAVAAAGVCAAALVLVALRQGEAARYQAEFTVGVLAVILLLAYTAQAVSGSRAGAPLCYVGRSSLVVYVVHYPAVIVAVEAMDLLGNFSPVTLFGAALAAGTLSGLVAIWARRHVPTVEALFSIPQRTLARSDAAGARRPTR